MIVWLLVKGLQAPAESAALALVALVMLAAGIVLRLPMPSLPRNVETKDPLRRQTRIPNFEDKSRSSTPCTCTWGDCCRH